MHYVKVFCRSLYHIYARRFQLNNHIFQLNNHIFFNSITTYSYFVTLDYSRPLQLYCAQVLTKLWEGNQLKGDLQDANQLELLYYQLHCGFGTPNSFEMLLYLIHELCFAISRSLKLVFGSFFFDTMVKYFQIVAGCSNTWLVSTNEFCREQSRTTL